MPRSSIDLEGLDEAALREEARRQGLPVGRSLSKAQLLELLDGETEASEGLDGPEDEIVRFPTLTMARLLAAQGDVEGAETVCREVLARRPDDAGAERLLAELTAAARAPAAAPVAVRTRAAGRQLDLPRCVLVALSPSRLHLHWEADAVAVALAEGHLGGRGRLVLRLFAAWGGPRGVERRTEDAEVSGPVGDRFVGPVRPGAVHRAALGLTDGTRFVPVVHSESVETPRGAASARRAPVTAPLRRRGRTPIARAEAERLVAALEAIPETDGPWRPRPGSRPKPGGESPAAAPAPPGATSSRAR